MLEQLSVDYIFKFILVFGRLGSAFSMFPALGDRYVFVRARLMLALAVTVIIFPIVSGYLPSYSKNLSVDVSYLIIEMLIGIVISIGAKFYFLCLSSTGQILALQSGLGSATFFDPMHRSQMAVFTNFFFILTTLSIFVSETHHLFIQSVIESYKRFPPGELLQIADISKYITHLVNDSFILAFKISSPFILVGLAILVGGGVLSRLMPNLQIFFVLTPAQILVMFMILYIVINSLINKVIEAMINASYY